MALTDANTTIPELSSRTYTATLLDEDDSAIASADISTIKLTVLDPAGNAINSRDRQDVFNTNNGTMHATSGLFTWEMQPADNVIAGSVQSEETEVHTVIIEVVLNNGTRENHRLAPNIRVTQLPHITS